MPFNLPSLIRFEAFLASLKSARFEDYAGKPDVNVAGPDEFAKMRDYLLKRCERTAVSHSFIGDDGSVYDCVAATESITPALELPPPPGPLEGLPQDARSAQPNAFQKGTDAMGNIKSCGPDMIPVRRLTLDQMVRSRTFQAFFEKSPDSAAGTPYD